MSVIILGGNERMVRQYKQLCREYRCQAKIFPKLVCNMKEKIGRPDLIVFFTNTMSHKMLRCAVNSTKGTDTILAHAHSSSITALRSILDEHAG